ncbi:MAG: hypothetical protein V3S16_04050 [Candidatus Desulfatibia sp.]
MDITEFNAGQTIQKLELTVAQLQSQLSEAENVQSQKGIDSSARAVSLKR